MARPVTAGIVCAAVGFTSSFTVVIAGLRAVGASTEQAASGLLAATILMGLATFVLTMRFRIPIVVAWSTPGAALLVSTGAVHGGWPAAVAAFLTVGILIVITGFWPAAADLIRRIPTSLAQAMLAGVLLPICLAPVTSAAHDPLAIVPVIVVWLVVLRFSSTWAVPAAFVAAAVVLASSIGLGDAAGFAASDIVPRIAFTVPHPTLQAMIGIALPLYVVTMASQNIPGVAVMDSFGYKVPWRGSMATTGAGTAIGALFGAHAINLAAISAALAAGPAAGADRDRRWIAGATSGLTCIVIGVLSTAAAAIMISGPEGVATTVAGLALLPALTGAIREALTDSDAHERLAAVVTFVVAGSGVAFGGIGAAFWAIVIGLGTRWWLRSRPSSTKNSV